MPKSHLFYTKGQEGEVRFQQSARPPRDQDGEEREEPDTNEPKRQDFQRSLNSFAAGITERVERRNDALGVPAHIDCIHIRFHNSFDRSFFESRYRNNFGLTATAYTEFNTVGVFAIADRGLFDRFLNDVALFINTADEDPAPAYHPDIRYVKEFTFFSSAMIKRYPELRPIAVFDLFSNVELYQNTIIPIYERLKVYLNERNISFQEDLLYNRLEVVGADEATINEIANNFDIVQSINSFAAGVVRPGPFNVAERAFGFEINNADEELPIIGIIDTGIARDTPLDGLIINEDEFFDLTATSVRIDQENHGTAVAALAALGDRLYPNHVGRFNSDAKLLSIKILHRSPGAVSETRVLEMIREANRRYGARIFVLTIGYMTHKKFNEEHTNYAYSLDRLSHELNILIVVSVGNVDDLLAQDGNRFIPRPYPALFDSENQNLLAPAESMNALTVGSAAWNMEEIPGMAMTPHRDFPTPYSRTHHINWSHPSITDKRRNKRLYKPDVICHSGDATDQVGLDPYGLKILSVTPGEFFNKQIGTSYAAPLVANMAARLLRLYPNIERMQTVKAIILNSCVCPKMDFETNPLSNTTEQGIYGNGLTNINRILYSNDDHVTFVLEGEIEPDKIRSYTLEVPNYLLRLPHKRGTLTVEATLCFSFNPVAHNQLAYCPIHMAFDIVRNVELESFEEEEIIDEDGVAKTKVISKGINKNSIAKIGIGQSWSQEYYYRFKLLSNAQKLKFNITKRMLEEEACKFKISVQCKLHKLLAAYQQREYQGPHPFSLVITISEIPVKKQNTHLLYNELVALNELQAIADADAIAEFE